MVSGGVASQADPLESLQYRIDEIEAAVDEATRWGSYVCAHAYSAKAIERAVRAGVRTIEHGNLIDTPTAALMAERGAYLVPTLVTYDAMKRRGPDYGLSAYSLAKNELVLQAGLRSLEICRTAGVKIGFGSDLLGQLQNDHCTEFTLRAAAMSPQEIIRSATLVNAEIVRQAGKLGELVPGAFADLLVVDGDPYRDLGVFRSDGARLTRSWRTERSCGTACRAGFNPPLPVAAAHHAGSASCWLSPRSRAHDASERPCAPPDGTPRHCPSIRHSFAPMAPNEINQDHTHSGKVNATTRLTTPRQNISAAQAYPAPTTSPPGRMPVAPSGT